MCCSECVVQQVLSLLLPSDTATHVLNVACAISTRMAHDKLNTWLSANVTQSKYQYSILRMIKVKSYVLCIVGYCNAFCFTIGFVSV